MNNEKERLQKRLDYMRSVEMAVIVSEEAEEEKKFARQKLDYQAAPRPDEQVG